MAHITINEISNTYSYNIGNNSYATVALPITSCWGPGYFDPNTLGTSKELELDETVWQRFPATQNGIEAFVTTYRGAQENYRLTKDFSYHMALTLMTAGYDVLVCRLCPGAKAVSDSIELGEGATFTLTAKYPGSFGNNLICTVKKARNRNYYNLITYIIDSSDVKVAVENIPFVFDPENATDAILHVDEIESSYVDIMTTGSAEDGSISTIDETGKTISFHGGTDFAAFDPKDMDHVVETMNKFLDGSKGIVAARFDEDDPAKDAYVQLVTSVVEKAIEDNDWATAKKVLHNEWLYANVLDVYDLLNDKLAYNHNRVISPGWDDIDFSGLGGAVDVNDSLLMSPIHKKLMEVAYHSRCATAYIDIPKSIPRTRVYNESTLPSKEGYAQLLSRFEPANSSFEINGTLYTTHSALFAPWGQYKYIGTSRYNAASPSFLALMLQRSMIKNQSLQYEWLLPSSRANDVKISKLDYTVPKKLLDVWQPTDDEGGVGINVITNIPGIGTTLWGNSTLYEQPAASYQALRNLSTRLLANAIEDVIYKTGISITFNYNNESAYAKFHAGVSSICDSMRNCGAIEDYYITMNKDLDSVGMVKANSVVGKVYLVVSGVINAITVDLIALPPATDLDAYRE